MAVNKGGRPKGSKAYLRVHKALKSELTSDKLKSVVRTLYELSQDSEVSPVVRRGCAKDLADLGINIEKSINAIEDEKEKAEGNGSKVDSLPKAPIVSRSPIRVQ